MSKRISLKASCAVLSLLAGQAALAQSETNGDSDDVIVVTATRRAVSILDVPQSIQAIGGEELNDLAINNVEDVVSLVPNLSIDEGRKYGGQFSIRGFGAQDAAFGTYSTVGVYMDEVPLTDGIANMDSALFDVDRVEVLRGPQGTLYGEGSLAGTVRIITNQPDLDDFSASLLGRAETTEDGSESYRVGGVLNAPLGEGAALRVSGAYDEVGGFLDSGPFPTGMPISEDVNGGESYHLRGALRFEPNAALSLTPSVSHQHNEVQSGPIDSIALPDLVGYSNGPDSFQDDLTITALEAEYDFGWATLSSSTSFYDRAFDS
ncbi:MAG: TonB-dependent receptor plug domain-containing protein, partial [Maricaulaceae bacterium]